MTFSVFTPLLTTILNLNLSTISVRLECATFSFSRIAWVLNFIAPSSLPTSFASCNSVGIQLRGGEAAGRSRRGGCGADERLWGGAGARLFSMEGVIVGGAFPAHMARLKFAASACSKPARSVFMPSYLLTRRSNLGMSDIIAIVLLSSTLYQKLFFFWSTFFDFFTLWLKLMAEIPRHLQQVSTIATRKRIITWMVQDESIHGLPGLYNRTIHAFPEYFRGQRSSNLIRASHWWALRHRYCNKGEEPKSFHQFHAPVADVEDKNSSVQRQHSVVVTNASNGYSGSTRSYLMHSSISKKLV